MMRFKWILLVFVFQTSFGQSKQHDFITRILSHPGPVEIFSFELSSNTMPILDIKDLKGTFQFSGQSLNKNSKGLFLNPVGTGRIYKWNGSPQAGNWKRIDSTFFTGYNFLSILFSVDSTLYNFGGTGFWYTNGNIRRYNPASNEWTADALNKSIPWTKDLHDIFYVDTSNNMFYFNGQGKYHDAILSNPVDSSSLGKIYRLDLKNKTVNELGNYEPIMGNFFGMTPWGTLISFYEIADLVNNKYYKVSQNVENNLFRVIAKSKSNRFAWQYSFWIDSALYFASPKNGYDSVIIHKSDLIPTNKPVYRKENNNKKSNTFTPIGLWIGLFVILVMANGILYYKYKKEKNKNNKNQNEFKNELSISEKTKLTEVEKSLLQMIFENSVLKKMTQINDINAVLGCANKNIEIQKRLRSDAINSINQKLFFIFVTDEKIIERKRSNFDARSFEYYIDEKHLQQVSKLLA